MRRMFVSLEGSVSQWIGELKNGDETAAQRLWERYVDRLICMAQRKLGAAPRRMSDEEDVAIVAFESFCRGTLEGRFPRLDDRNDLWQVLVMLTQRKATDQVRKSLTRRRTEVGESHLAGPDDSQSRAAGAAGVVGPEPTPEFAAQVADEFRTVLDALGDETLRRVAQWKMEGFTNQEIAEKLGCVERTVERKLEMIRERWEAMDGPTRTAR
jgi:RNA polymerase sigma factor (sigma-70 family)